MQLPIVAILFWTSLLSPAHAHGMDAMVSFSAHALIFIIGFAALLFIKSPIKRKFIALLPLLAGIAFVRFTWNIPYNDNILLINVGGIGTAILSVVLSIWLQKRPDNKT